MAIGFWHSPQRYGSKHGNNNTSTVVMVVCIGYHLTTFTLYLYLSPVLLHVYKFSIIDHYKHPNRTSISMLCYY